MALTPELQAIYTSAPVNISFYEGLVLSHPTWDGVIAIMTNTATEKTKIFNGAPVVFSPASFSVTLPKRDDLGLVELSVNFPIVSRMMVELIERAERSQTAITATLAVYIDSSDEPQMTPVELQMDQIAITEDLISGNASRVDMLNKVFPRNVVRPEMFPGLYR